MERAVTTHEAVVGNVSMGPRGLGPAFAVRLPITRLGQPAYILSAVIPTEHMRTVLLRENVPGSSVVSVFDRDLNRVARSRPHPFPRPAPSLQDMLRAGAAEGTGVTYTLEGRRSHTGYTHLQRWGWVVATGISAEDANSGLYGALAAVGAGLLASLALAAFVAWYLARDVTEPIHALKAAAGALGRGEPVRLQPLGIAELQDVGKALEQASAERDRAARERHAAEAERETLLARSTEALRRAEEAGRSKDEFLAMLGHELRNPLAPMATALHLMMRRGDPATRAEREVMERQVRHMKRLVDDLLDVSHHRQTPGDAHAAAAPGRPRAACGPARAAGPGPARPGSRHRGRRARALGAGRRGAARPGPEQPAGQCDQVHRAAGLDRLAPA
jgi:hypothetical protein